LLVAETCGQFLDARELQAVVGDLFEDAVQLGLGTEDADQGGDTVAGFGDESVKCGRETRAQSAANGDAVTA
jgi:hypothetical protein